MTHSHRNLFTLYKESWKTLTCYAFTFVVRSLIQDCCQEIVLIVLIFITLVIHFCFVDLKWTSVLHTCQQILFCTYYIDIIYRLKDPLYQLSHPPNTFSSSLNGYTGKVRLDKELSVMLSLVFFSVLFRNSDHLAISRGFNNTTDTQAASVVPHNWRIIWLICV